MKTKTLLFLLVLSQIHLKSQVFNDTIVSIERDTIICKIGLVNNLNIFYEFNPKKKKVVSTHIDRRNVEYFSAPSIDVTILEQEILSEVESVEEQFTEENGIIYPNNVDAPPRFQNGMNDLHRYLENNVTIRSLDHRVFGSNYVVVLYSLVIDSKGAVSSVSIAESSAVTGGYTHECRFLETEIQNVLSQMPDWAPAIVGNEASSMRIYLPIKFRIEQHSLAMYSAKYSFVFKNRK
jgi:hypothetical protein